MVDRYWLLISPAQHSKRRESSNWIRLSLSQLRGRSLLAFLGHAAAALSSLSGPRITILSASSGNGRWRALASSHGARIHTSCSSSVVRITGIAFEWIGSTIAFGAVVRKP